ncbi:hypothetical protein [Bacillus sp. AFS040349]|uniref:hypothetical protein n=1 Tax=Bacillus sp. AFS040349 TaxID=2033502 RepID=UPI000BFBDBAB|nr:hypothetical protein [Bacillus sp. AFS040349]PGT83241.1 hypothetical protein COD11_12970 [Bacillus sp. AFS040349]
MTFDFYTFNSKFSIGEDFIMKNGEVIAEGNVFLFQVLLGYPAYLIVNTKNEFCLPLVVKTEPITSVLPEYEFFDGSQRPHKYLYEVDFIYQKKPRKFNVMAVDAAHARDLIEMNHKKAEFKLIKRIKGEKISC